MVTQVCSSSFWKDTPVVVDEGISEVQGTTGSACDDAQNSSGQSKRTKKKKKKKKATDGQAPEAPEMRLSPEEKKQAEKRFSNVYNALLANDSSCLWADLKNCNVTDSKVKKLEVALADNTTVTHLDLSRNSLTDSGIQGLASCLTFAASQLITLDVSGNKLTDVGTNMLTGLGKLRKKLQITHTVNGDKALPSGSSDVNFDPSAKFSGKSKSKTTFEQKHFQIGDGSEDGNLERAEAKLLWEDVRMIVECDRPQTSKLKDLLLLAVAKISDEMNMCQLPLLQSTTLAELLPYTKSAVECVSMLGSVLIMEPEGRPRQHSLTTALPVVGLHRLAAAQLVAQLLRGQASCINDCIDQEGILPTLLQVTLAHPDCSALQSVCLRILRAALCTPALCDNLLRKPDGDCEDVPLQASLAQVVSSATDVPIAKRSPVIGFALAASKMLRDWCQGNSEGATCKLWDKGDEPWLCAGRPRCKASYLQTDEVWSNFTRKDGVLDVLLEKQNGELSGPVPFRSSEGSSVSVSAHDFGLMQLNSSRLTFQM